MIIQFKTKQQLLNFFNQYLIYDDELLGITLLLDEEKLLKS